EGGGASQSNASSGSDNAGVSKQKKRSVKKATPRKVQKQRNVATKKKPTVQPRQRALIKAAPRVQAPPKVQAAPFERFANNEIVTLSLNEADLALLLARGYRVLEQRSMFQFGFVSRRLAIPQGTSLEAARDEVRALASGADADFNHYYRSQQGNPEEACSGPHCASFEQIGWTISPNSNCTFKVAVGVIDTGINPAHPTFASTRLEVHKLTPGALNPSRAIHGTAVTAMLIGNNDSRSPGLLPGARVVAVDAFYSEGKDERADVFTLVAALELLVTKGIRIVNMSLAGPPNAVLERAIGSAIGLDVVVVAATGNGGPTAAPVYPAAYSDVVAVTAIDAAGVVYRRAGRGGHVDLAAPGVKIWTAASIDGAKTKTGTSFATPFVSAAAAAYLAAEPDAKAKTVIDLLKSSALDLGTPGFDTIYGHGLVQAGPSCAKT
ncbi:MAG: S8 family serine peptidase, partial [Notoacmeibacter sp.]